MWAVRLVEEDLLNLFRITLVEVVAGVICRLSRLSDPMKVLWDVE